MRIINVYKYISVEDKIMKQNSGVNLYNYLQET